MQLNQNGLSSIRGSVIVNTNNVFYQLGSMAVRKGIIFYKLKSYKGLIKVLF